MVWFEVSVGIAIFIHIAFIIALLKKDNSIMTFMWPLGLLLIQLITYRIYSPQELGLQLLFVFTVLWAIRLFLQTFIRNIKRGYEDFRYRELRDSGGSLFLVKSYFQFFIIQGLFMLIVGIIFVYPYSIDYETNFILTLVAVGLFTIGFLLETLSDLQLFQFKQSHEKDEILTSGLWKYTRHPNYLGEIIVWWSLGLLSFQISIWWILASPLIITLLLRFVSGVPLVEKRYEGNPQYQKYKENTPTLFPF